MSEGKKNIIGTFFFLLVASSIFFLAFFSGSGMNEKIDYIKLEGNFLLDQDDYLDFIRVKNSRDYNNLTLSLIRDRFLKHPYIGKADIKFEDKTSVKVYLTEKKIIALIVEDLETYFLSADHQIFPVLSDTKFIELPVITNSSFFMRGRKTNYADINQAAKIINAAELTDPELFSNLSEINLRNGGDVILSFNGIRPPVIFGRNEEARKMICLETLLNNEVQKNYLNHSANYLDLRFSNRIFVGKNEYPESINHD